MADAYFSRFYKYCKDHFVIPHVLFWFVSMLSFLLLLFYTRGVQLAHIDFQTAVSILITLLYLAVSVYINLLWLIPKFFKKRRFWLFSLLQISNILLFILLNYFTSHAFEAEHPEFLNEAIAEAILVFIFLIVTTLLKFMRDSIALQDAELKVKEIESQKVRAELQALKSQVNPHFFFNTLNSLYALSLDKSDKVPDMILKLSDLMRYVIYESQDTQVPLNKQLEFLKSYIFLEKMRVDEQLDVRFSVFGDCLHMRIDPLIFIAFIENAFKHGSKSNQNKPYIYIEFHAEEPNRIRFSIENSIDAPAIPMAQTGNGFGLNNVKKRLELLYPGHHSLEILETPETYRINLSICMDCV